MSDTAALEAEAQRFRDDFQRLRESVGRVIVGQQRVIEGVLVAIISGGNVLLEGVPGLGKTELVKALARALDLDFRRIQFTPDLMPADIIGTTVMTAGPTAGISSSSVAARFSRSFCSRTKSTAPLQDPVGAARNHAGRQCNRRRADAHPATLLSSSSRPKTRWSRKAPIHCRKRSWTGSCSS
jgi:MoxR-like ATPase